MLAIGFDFDLLSTPYGTKRCIYQLYHYCRIAQLLGLDVRAIVNKEVIKACPYLKLISEVWSDNRKGLDIYVSKADALYYDDNWEKVTSKISAYKICMCNSDRCFRENIGFNESKAGSPVQTRCNLYMPVNYTEPLLKKFGHKTIPMSHPIDIKIFKQFNKDGLDIAFYNDNVDIIRSEYYEPETALARFMGYRTPDREKYAQNTPWAEIVWSRTTPAREYIKFMMQARACLDFRGYGDKSIRFTEAVLLGRTIITANVTSKYFPPLIDNYNCILRPKWGNYLETHKSLDESWHRMANMATQHYKTKWSMRAQLLTMLDRFKSSI